MHHTKDKGDLGVAKAHADLVEQGFVVCNPLTEHAPFDLVAYKEGNFQRVQVKYRAAKNGAVTLLLRATWSDRNGVHHRPMDLDAIDVICVFCPDTDRCYYIRPPADVANLTLRISPSKNNQRWGVRNADDYRVLDPVGLPEAPFRDDGQSPVTIERLRRKTLARVHALRQPTSEAEKPHPQG